VTLAAGLLVAVPATAQAQAPDQQRQQAFTAAAGEFGVPESVLLGVAYLESRWDYNAGTPSTAAGYGPMHLTDLRAAGSGSHHDDGEEDFRGDDASAAVRPQTPPPTQPPPELQTIDVAARLTHNDVQTLRTDATQNIRGGAALLADYQRKIGARGDTPSNWYGAVARYSGAADTAAAAAFADEVFDTISTGVSRTTDDGQRLLLAAAAGLAPVREQLRALGLRETAPPPGLECPSGVSCESVPAPYQELPNNDYGNHDLADRPQSQQINYIIIHDTEGYFDTAMRLVQDPAYVSWHYTIRSSDGHIAQHVPTKDVAWHAGNWYVNSKSVGIEHEGFAAKGTWYTEAMSPRIVETGALPDGQVRHSARPCTHPRPRQRPRHRPGDDQGHALGPRPLLGLVALFRPARRAAQPRIGLPRLRLGDDHPRLRVQPARFHWL
jgi:hypothetical protein